MTQGDTFGLTGTVLDGRYQIDTVIGEGGFGVVYRGKHLSLQHPIAIKCLKTPAHFSPQAQETFFSKFREEGQLLSRLRDCPGIVHVHDFGITHARTNQSIPYLVLEWLDGVTLEAHLAQRRAHNQGVLSFSDAISLLAPVFDALAFAHRMKIAHRDIKPANIFLANTARGLTIKVLDFGIAKAMQELDSAQQAATGTGSGFSAFSPAYGSPEQFFSKRYGATGPWTDVHALALILVELLTGRPALQGDDMAELLISATAVHRPTPRQRGVWLPDAIEAVITHALAIVPNQRYANAEQFYETLRQAMHASHLPVPGPLPSLASAYGPPGIPIQPAYAPAYTPTPSPAPVGAWQSHPLTSAPTALPQSTEVAGYYGSSIQYGNTTPAPRGHTEQAGFTQVAHPSESNIPRGTEVALGGGTSIPWTSPTPPPTPVPVPTPPKKPKGTSFKWVGLLAGLFVMGGGLLGSRIIFKKKLPTSPTPGRIISTLTEPSRTEWAREIVEGKEVYGLAPLSEQERKGRSHFQIKIQGSQVQSVEQFNPAGDVIETIRFEREGNRRTKIVSNDRGVETLRTVYQGDGTAITTQRSGEIIDHGCARVRYIYGDSGNIEERSCLSPTGVSIMDDEGCTLWRYTYAPDHRRLSSGCFSVDERNPRGVPTENKDGFHLVKIQKDLSGASQRLQFFDAMGAPVARLSDGCYGKLQTYDSAGNQISDTCLDTTNAPRLMKGRTSATTRWSFDSNGCILRQSYEDTTGTPTKSGTIAYFQVQPDTHCNNLCVELHASDGTLVRDPAQGEHIALRENEYNERNDLIGIKCYDEKRSPTDCGGYSKPEGALVRMDVDDRGRTISRKYFYIDGRPSIYPGGYPHEIRMTYGEDGRLATQTFLNETGGFASALGSVGRITMRYDAMGNLLSQAFLSVTGVPVESSIGCHEVRYTYDPRNRLASIECRSTSNDLKIHKGWQQSGINWPAGAARMTVERSDTIVNIYNAPDGRIVKRVECKTMDQLCYR